MTTNFTRARGSFDYDGAKPPPCERAMMGNEQLGDCVTGYVDAWYAVLTVDVYACTYARAYQDNSHLL